MTPPAVNSWLRDQYTGMMRDRFQGAVRAQTRYLFLLLLISAYTVAAHLTPGDVVEVPFLGLKVPRQLVEAFAVSALGILLLGLFGSEEMMRRLLLILPAAFNVEDKKLPTEFFESEPNLLDFLPYCTYRNGNPTVLTPVGWLVLYPMPLVAVLYWAIWLWWAGVHDRMSAWSWLVVVHVINAAILLLALVRLVIFVLYVYQRAMSGRAAIASSKRESTEP
jgi:hypothetical protein